MGQALAMVLERPASSWTHPGFETVRRTPGQPVRSRRQRWRNPSTVRCSPFSEVCEAHSLCVDRGAYGIQRGRMLFSLCRRMRPWLPGEARLNQRLRFMSKHVILGRLWMMTKLDRRNTM
ncbi:hypothetical protein ACFX2F_022602 [Malus domestica]